MTSTRTEARRDCDRAKELDRIIKGAQSGPNPLQAVHDYHAPTLEEQIQTLLDRQATREAQVRRRVARHAHCLRIALDEMELSGKRPDEVERMKLMDVLVAARRALA